MSNQELRALPTFRRDYLLLYKNESEGSITEEMYKSIDKGKSAGE